MGGKVTQNAALPKPRKLSKTVTKPQAKESQDDIVNDSEPDCPLGGMGEEDDTLEKEAAMSSPMKGSESCEVGKARIHLTNFLTVGGLTACVVPYQGQGQTGTGTRRKGQTGTGTRSWKGQTGIGTRTWKAT